MPTSRAGSKGSPRPPAAPAGFTLIELVIVMLLIGLVTAVTVPNLSAVLSPSPLDRSVETVVQALREARLAAVRTGVPRQLRVATGAAPGRPGTGVRLTEHVAVRSAGGEAVVTFYPTGLSSGAAWRFEDRAGESRLVRVSLLESAITVEP